MSAWASVFAEPAWLLLVPVFVAIAVMEMLRLVRTSGTRPWPRMVRVDVGGGRVSPGKGRCRPLLWLGLIGVAAALARPQWGTIETPVLEKGREVLVALDLSRSMLAEDVKPSRLERSKLLLQALLERLKGERVGLELFAGSSFLQCPLSNDYEIMRDMLAGLSCDYLPQGGTDFAQMLRTAGESFSATDGAAQFLVVLSDGEDLSESWKAEAEKLKARGVRVIALGVGTATGSVIPARNGQGLAKDERGAVVMSKLNPVTLQQLADITGGVYRDASTWVDIAAEVEQLVQAGREGTFKEDRQVRKVERFQWVLGPALLLLLLSLGLEFPARPRAQSVGRVKLSRLGPAVACLLLLPGAAWPAEPQPAAPPDPLAQTVTQLSAQPALSAKDCAAFAEATLEHGTKQRQSGGKLPKGVVQDGLAAVQQGRAADATAAPWDKLEAGLKQLLEEPPPQDQKQQQKDKQKQQDKDKDKDQKQKDQKKDDSQKDEKSGDEQQKKDESSQDKPSEDGKPQDKSQDQKQDPSGQPKPGEESTPKDGKPQDKPDGSGQGQQDKPSDEGKKSAEGKSEDQPPGEKQAPQPDSASLQNLGQTNAAPPQVANPGTQKVGGKPAPGESPVTGNPELGAAFRALEEARGKDAPVRLFQLLDATNRNSKAAPPAASDRRDY